MTSQSSEKTRKHDRHIQQLMERARERGLVFNPDKCKLKEAEVEFFGNVYSKHGVRADPAKVQAIKDLKTPSNTQESQLFLGLITYLSSYIPNLSEHSAPLLSLLHKDSEF